MPWCPNESWYLGKLDLGRIQVHPVYPPYPPDLQKREWGLLTSCKLHSYSRFGVLRFLHCSFHSRTLMAWRFAFIIEALSGLMPLLLAVPLKLQPVPFLGSRLTEGLAGPETSPMVLHPQPLHTPSPPLSGIPFPSGLLWVGGSHVALSFMAHI